MVSRLLTRFLGVAFGRSGFAFRIEQRCPLAQYGCPLSIRRLNPCSPMAVVFHSSELQSFGLKYSNHVASQPSSSGDDYFTALPDEILLKILPLLDGERCDLVG